LFFEFGFLGEYYALIYFILFYNYFFFIDDQFF
jgi:hypothetical protein